MSTHSRQMSQPLLSFVLHTALQTSTDSTSTTFPVEALRLPPLAGATASRLTRPDSPLLFRMPNASTPAAVFRSSRSRICGVQMLLSPPTSLIPATTEIGARTIALSSSSSPTSSRAAWPSMNVRNSNHTTSRTFPTSSGVAANNSTCKCGFEELGRCEPLSPRAAECSFPL